MIKAILRTVLLVSLMSPAQVGAFVVKPKLANTFQSMQSARGQVPVVANRFRSDARENRALFMADDKSYDDGISRGIPILGVILLACVWCFTIPPEFRRAYICSDGCAANRETVQCNSCVTGEEWTNGVKEYYRNGGGIEWDFSIDPNSKMKVF